MKLHFFLYPVVLLCKVLFSAGVTERTSETHPSVSSSNFTSVSEYFKLPVAIGIIPNNLKIGRNFHSSLLQPEILPPKQLWSQTTSNALGPHAPTSTLPSGFSKPQSVSRTSYSLPVSPSKPSNTIDGVRNVTGNHQDQRIPRGSLLHKNIYHPSVSPRNIPLQSVLPKNIFRQSVHPTKIPKQSALPTKVPQQSVLPENGGAGSKVVLPRRREAKESWVPKPPDERNSTEIFELMRWAGNAREGFVPDSVSGDDKVGFDVEKVPGILVVGARHEKQQNNTGFTGSQEVVVGRSSTPTTASLGRSSWRILGGVIKNVMRRWRTREKLLPRTTAAQPSFKGEERETSTTKASSAALTYKVPISFKIESKSNERNGVNDFRLDTEHEPKTPTELPEHVNGQAKKYLNRQRVKRSTDISLANRFLNYENKIGMETFLDESSRAYTDADQSNLEDRKAFRFASSVRDRKNDEHEHLVEKNTHSKKNRVNRRSRPSKVSRSGARKRRRRGKKNRKNGHVNYTRGRRNRERNQLQPLYAATKREDQGGKEDLRRGENPQGGLYETPRENSRKRKKHHRRGSGRIGRRNRKRLPSSSLALVATDRESELSSSSAVPYLESRGRPLKKIKKLNDDFSHLMLFSDLSSRNVFDPINNKNQMRMLKLNKNAHVEIFQPTSTTESYLLPQAERHSTNLRFLGKDYPSRYGLQDDFWKRPLERPHGEGFVINDEQERPRQKTLPVQSRSSVFDRFLPSETPSDRLIFYPFLSKTHIKTTALPLSIRNYFMNPSVDEITTKKLASLPMNRDIQVAIHVLPHNDDPSVHLLYPNDPFSSSQIFSTKDSSSKEINEDKSDNDVNSDSRGNSSLHTDTLVVSLDNSFRGGESQTPVNSSGSILDIHGDLTRSKGSPHSPIEEELEPECPDLNSKAQEDLHLSSGNSFSNAEHRLDSGEVSRNLANEGDGEGTAITPPDRVPGHVEEDYYYYTYKDNPDSGIVLTPSGSLDFNSPILTLDLDPSFLAPPSTSLTTPSPHSGPNSGLLGGLSSLWGSLFAPNPSPRPDTGSPGNLDTNNIYSPLFESGAAISLNSPNPGDTLSQTYLLSRRHGSSFRPNGHEGSTWHRSSSDARAASPTEPPSFVRPNQKLRMGVNLTSDRRLTQNHHDRSGGNGRHSSTHLVVSQKSDDVGGSEGLGNRPDVGSGTPWPTGGAPTDGARNYSSSSQGGVSIVPSARQLVEEIVRTLEQLMRQQALNGSLVKGDPCDQWSESSVEQALGHLSCWQRLPACPCRLPPNLAYRPLLWDQHTNATFRWRSVSASREHVEVYLPGATECIRSVAMQPPLATLAAQTCCYDRWQQLLTRGSGAGSPVHVSPEVSPALHRLLDVAPWVACRGNFARFHKFRPPNNGMDCQARPPDGAYAAQLQDATDY